MSERTLLNKVRKLKELEAHQKEVKVIYPLIVEYAAATEKRGFTAGFY